MASLPTIDTVLEWRGRNIVDTDGEKIGKFEEIYLDSQTDRPEWASVKTGRFGRNRTFVPLSQASEAGDDLQVPWKREHVEAAPNVDDETELSQDEEAKLYGHYGLEYSKGQSETGLPPGGPGAGTPAAAEQSQSSEAQAAAPADTTQGQAAGPGASAQPAAAQPDKDAEPSGASGGGQAAPGAPGTPGPSDEGAGREGGEAATGAAAGASAQGTEQPSSDDVSVETGPRERVRLRKYVVTEQVTRTVPVQREEVRVEREPLSGSDQSQGRSEQQ